MKKARGDEREKQKARVADLQARVVESEKEKAKALKGKAKADDRAAAAESRAAESQKKVRDLTAELQEREVEEDVRAEAAREVAEGQKAEALEGLYGPRGEYSWIMRKKVFKALGAGMSPAQVRGGCWGS